MKLPRWLNHRLAPAVYGCACGKWFRSDAALQKHDNKHWRDDAKAAKLND